MSEKKKKNNIGFYTALCCCIAALGIVGFVNANRTPKETENTLWESDFPEAGTLPPVITYEEEVPANAGKIIEVTEAPKEKEKEKEKEEKTQPPEPSKSPEIVEAGENPDFYDGPIIESVSIKDSPKILFPANGIITRDFSGETLYYDPEMEDYRTHNGIRIEAPADSDVIAASDGKIEECYEDITGKTIVINHGNGFKTKYSNLDDISNLKNGMEIKRGDFIAHVGKNRNTDNQTESYIYFELTKNDEFVNPEDYFE